VTLFLCDLIDQATTSQTTHHFFLIFFFQIIMYKVRYVILVYGFLAPQRYIIIYQ